MNKQIEVTLPEPVEGVPVMFLIGVEDHLIAIVSGEVGIQLGAGANGQPWITVFHDIHAVPQIGYQHPPLPWKTTVGSPESEGAQHDPAEEGA